MNDNEILQQEIGALQRRLDQLDERTREAWLETSPVAQELLAEIGTAIEELRVSEEELRVSNEALAASRDALEAERARYWDLFHSAPDAYLVTDTRGVIREANRAAAELLRIEPRYLTGKPLAVFVAEPERAHFRNRLDRLGSQEPGGEWELTLTPRGAPPISVAVTTRFVQDTAAQATELQWLLRDISERKASEEQARQLAAERLARAEAEAENQTKSEFLAVMSHELRTPLTVILGFTELLRMGVPAAIPTPAQQQVERIDAAARHLLQLIEEVLTFSRLQADREQLQPHSADLCELAREVAAFVEPLASKRGLPLRLELPEEPLLAMVDQGKVRQILVNLLFNAIKFTPEGEVRLELEAEEEQALFRVRDTGIGIAAENLGKIFEPFWQAEQGNTRTVGGTGLGLAVSRSIMELLGGTLEVESTPGGGTTFTACLPLQPASRRRARAPHHPAVAG